jgi:hypothetical protein
MAGRRPALVPQVGEHRRREDADERDVQEGDDVELVQVPGEGRPAHHERGDLGDDRRDGGREDEVDEGGKSAARELGVDEACVPRPTPQGPAI